MKRRSFLHAVGGVVGSSALVNSGSAEAAENKTIMVDGMPRRVLGRTGFEVSMVCFPGLALKQQDQAEGTAGLHKVFDNGLNYFDVAPAYGKDGECEIKMGIGLQDIKREDYYLSCKTKMRDAKEAQVELDRSLQRLKTDYFDLYQLHFLRDPGETRDALARRGAMETILKAKEQGKIRAIGFSAHTTKAALTALQEFDFDTVMFPINFVEQYTIGFGKAVLDLANEKGTAVIAMKCMSLGTWPEGATKTRNHWYRAAETEEELDLTWRYAMSQPRVACGIPPAFLDLTDKAIDTVKRLKPITDEELKRTHELAKECESQFRREEDRVAHHRSRHDNLYPDSPYEGGCPGEMA